MEQIKRMKELMGINETLIPINETTLNRIMQTHGKHGFVIISAYRNERTPAENRAMHLQLMKDVKNAGFSFMKVFGGFIEDLGTDNPKEVQEPALFIPNFPIGKSVPFEDTQLLKKVAIAFCNKYDQDAVLFKDIEGTPKYIDKRGNVDMEFNGDYIINHDDEQYFTKINKNNNGRFTLAAEMYVVQPPKTINGRHLKLLKEGETFIADAVLKG